MKKILTAICVAATTLTACNDNFLEKYPLTDLTEENAFKEYDNLQGVYEPLLRDVYEHHDSIPVSTTAI